ncbi:MAG: hypothetical protein JW940_34380 [Polyangiaceae bacterium]|nr:hypothetical protein [Polyangiaceae bacterium]
MVRRREKSVLGSTALGVCALACGLAAGCASSGTANIGDGELSVDKTELSSYAAAWNGYVEAFSFPSGSDRVRVTLDEQGDGWLQIGDVEQLAAPTNPDVGWPEGVFGIRSEVTPGMDLMEGVRYPITGAVVQQERIRLSVDPYDAFKAWCELQTSVLHQGEVPARYGCSLNAGYGWNEEDGGVCTVGTDNGESIPIDCGKAIICAGSVCACDETACTAGDGDSVPFDAALDDDGQSLTGSIVLPDVGARIVRLQR